jgi:ceramide synthetase
MGLMQRGKVSVKTLSKTERQRRNYIPPVNPLVDNALTAFFLVQAVWAFYTFANMADGSGQETVSTFVALLVVCAAAFACVRVAGRRLGDALSNGVLAAAPFHHPLKSRKVMKKWTDQCWQLFIHSAMSCFGYYIIFIDSDGANASWWTDSPAHWSPCPTDPATGARLQRDATPAIVTYYLFCFAIWFYTAYSHRFVEERRRDYVVMYIHHVVTIALLLGSFASGAVRVGLMVQFVHDVSDIPIDLLKMTNYLKLENKEGFFLSEAVFFGNLVSWIYLRLYIFPTRLIAGAAIYGHIMCANLGSVGSDTQNRALTYVCVLQLDSRARKSHASSPACSTLFSPFFSSRSLMRSG